MKVAPPRTLKLALNATMLAGGVALLTLAGVSRSAEAGEAPRGGTFRILALRDGLDFVDPAQAYQVASWAILDASCALLLRRPDLPPPAGYRPVPEVAASYPTVSSDGKTYTFTTRKGFRFSDGRPLTARNFAAAIGRLKNPALDSPAAPFTREIVRARAVASNRLVIRLSKHVPDFTARMTLPFFCPVPLGLPNVPEGAGAPFSGAGPYYIASWQPRGELVAARNRFYRGKRAQNVDRFVVRETESPDFVASFRAVERGEADWFAGAPLGVPVSIREELAEKYGVNKSQYFIRRAPITAYLALNTERQLFRNNVRLRQAVNFAVDRPAVLRASAGASGPRHGNPTDQLLPPTMPGFRNALLYPLKGPNLTRARALARGRTRGGKAVLYVRDNPSGRVLGAVVRANLDQIGLDVEIKPFPPGPFAARVFTRGEPYDMVHLAWGADYIDPANFLSLLDGRTIRDRENFNNSYFSSSTFNRELDRANRLTGDRRLRALGELDVRVARDEAPLVPLYHLNEHVFVSKRVGCLVFNNWAGSLNVGASCLKR
jgi:peptide/nickel transport system substrate-binding protein